MNEAYGCLSRALLYAGDVRGAVEALRPHTPPENFRAWASLAPAQAMRNIFEARLRASPALDPYQRAWRLAWMGSRDEALDALEQGFQNRSMMMPMVAVDPAFASLRDHARFRKIVHDLGLSQR
jgi:hypothetical protein